MAQVPPGFVLDDDEEEERRRSGLPQGFVLDPQEPDAPVTGAGAAVSQPFAGFNRGVDQAFRAVSGAGRLVTDRIFEGANALFGTEFDTSRPSVSPIREMQRAVSGQTYDDLPVNTTYDRYAQRVGEEVGASIPALFGIGAAGQAVNAGSRGGLFGSAVNEFARRPAVYAAADGASSVASGVGAQAASDAVPGNRWAEMAGQLAAPLTLFGVPATVRGVFRGAGRQAAQTMQGRIDDAARAGTNLTAGQLPGSTADSYNVPAMMEAASRNLPGGNLVFNRVYQRQADDVARSLDDLASRLSSLSTPEGAGQSIRRGVDDIAAQFSAEADRLYSAVDNLIAPQTPVQPSNTLAAVRDLAADIPGAPALSRSALGDGAMRSIRDALEKDLTTTELRMYDRVVGPNGTIPYEAVAGLRSVIGRKLGQSELVSDVPRANLERLYAALSDDIGQAAANAGPDAQAAWSQANTFYREGRRALDDYVQPLIANRRESLPEASFREFELSARRGPTGIREFRNRLLMTENGRQRWDDTVAVILRRMGRAVPSQQGADGDDFSFSTFLTNWNRLKESGGLDELFTGTSYNSLRDDLDAIARTAERVRAGSQVLQNNSGSAQAALGGGSAAALGGMVGGDMASAGTFFLSSVGGSAGTGYLMSRPWFVRWLAQTTEEPVERAPSLLTRLANTAYFQGDERDKEAVQAFIRAYEPREDALAQSLYANRNPERYAQPRQENQRR